MGRMNRASVLIGAIAVLMLSVAAVTITSRVTSAGSPTPTTTQQATPDCAANQAADATETKDSADTDQVDEQCGSQDAADASGAAGATEQNDATETDSVEQQDGPQDAPDTPATP